MGMHYTELPLLLTWTHCHLNKEYFDPDELYFDDESDMNPS